MGAAIKPKLRLGMVGGGEGAFIGNVHRFAARLDNRYELVAGALSSQEERARHSADVLGIERSYKNYKEMVLQESLRSDGIQVVSIVTPNHLHAEVALAFLEKGIHVICDKPLTASLDQAEELLEKSQLSNAKFMLTHNYSAYPMVREAKEIVAHGKLGKIRSIQVEYAQDWLTEPLEKRGNKQASWRSDPSKAGMAGCMGDIGSHAYQLACFIIGSEANKVLADLSSWGEGRELDDEANILVHFHNGAKGHLWASQVAPGNENSLKIRIFGDKAGIEWEQENPNSLHFTELGHARQTLTRGQAYLSDASLECARIPPGHPEGYLEAFGNLYREFADMLLGETTYNSLPTIEDGVHGMFFIKACVESHQHGSVWRSV